MNDAKKKFLLAELYKLSLPAQDAVKELLTYYEQRQTIEAAEKFLSNLPALPTNKLPIDSDLFIKLNTTFAALKNSPRWFSTTDLPHEIWRDIISYEGFYQISNLDRVKSFHKRKPRILTNSIDANGYAVVNLSVGDKPKKIDFHILVARAFLPNLLSITEMATNKMLACGIWNR